MTGPAPPEHEVSCMLNRLPASQRDGCKGQSYRHRRPSVHIAVVTALLFVLLFPPATLTRAAERPVRIVALGDSLTAGLGLAAGQSFPAKLERALRAKGLEVEIVNAGVSGATAANG